MDIDSGNVNTNDSNNSENDNSNVNTNENVNEPDVDITTNPVQQESQGISEEEPMMDQEQNREGNLSEQTTVTKSTTKSGAPQPNLSQQEDIV